MSIEEEILNSTRVVAVVGLSPKPDRPSYNVASYLKKNGYKIIYCPNCSIIHYGGQSSEKMPQVAMVHSYRSRLYFFYKHYTKPKAFILRFFLIGGLYEQILLLPITNIFRRSKRVEEYISGLKAALKWYREERGRLIGQAKSQKA